MPVNAPIPDRAVEPVRDASEEPLIFRVAREPWEFEAIHRLNYETFVEEIPQHAPNAERCLVDRFHHENTYIVAARGERVVGMIALRSKRPFSLDGKLANLDAHLPLGAVPCEIRLLATTKDSRQGFVFRGLVRELARHARSLGHDVAVISGTVRQLRLYRHLGFEPFGPLVGSADAPYQPMRLSLATFEARGRAFLVEPKSASRTTLRFLPGPVAVRPSVRAAIARDPVSHRSPHVTAALARIVARLKAMTGVENVQLIPGSGTLGNDAVAHVIASWATPGLVLTNGVFGDRLEDQARRAGLAFETFASPWGSPFDFDEVDHRCARLPPDSWIWAVHGETSTGVLNHLPALLGIAQRHRMRLAIDAVSSLGATPLDLRGVSIASSTSGKALGALPGIAIVLRDGSSLAPLPRAGRAVDLRLHESLDGIPHTISSTLLFALEASLESAGGAEHFERIAQLGARVRAACPGLGLRVVATDSHFDAVTTLEPPFSISAFRLGELLEIRGIEVHYRTRELRQRNWMQIALMSEPDGAAVERLLAELALAVRRAS
jgi:aspartate aminotransferase-like enzyme/predicted N-acetyltransferase YhbS